MFVCLFVCLSVCLFTCKLLFSDLINIDILYMVGCGILLGRSTSILEVSMSNRVGKGGPNGDVSYVNRAFGD